MVRTSSEPASVMEFAFYSLLFALYFCAVRLSVFAAKKNPDDWNQFIESARASDGRYGDDDLPWLQRLLAMRADELRCSRIRTHPRTQRNVVLTATAVVDSTSPHTHRLITRSPNRLCLEPTAPAASGARKLKSADIRGSSNETVLGLLS